MKDAFDFTGKVALVTGSSRGIGASVLTALGECGARCVLNYIADADGTQRAEAERVAAGLGEPRLIPCDVADARQVAAMMDEIHSAFGGLDILVNNAGILRDRTIKKMSAEEWESVIRVNLTGAFNCIQRAMPLLRTGGRVVSIASVSAELGPFGQANYASSKAGLIALSKVAARELASQQITVNVVAPGVIETTMTRAMPEEARKQFLAQIPLGRVGEVGDVVFAVLTLCSPRARYITGQTLHVNGGLYLP